jgi:hypothetical protein
VHQLYLPRIQGAEGEALPGGELPEEQRGSLEGGAVSTATDWHNCYDGSWKGEIAPEAFSHPAKYSRLLIKRIYQHILEEGWVREGDTILDPFGGVALGGLDAMVAGLNWLGVELEERFVILGNQNIEQWNKRYAGKLPKWGRATLLQGDSRNLVQVVAEACVSSPPYADSDQDYKEGWKRFHVNHEPLWRNDSQREAYYGSTPGQLGAMKAEGFEAAVSSPPFKNSLSHDGRGYADLKIAKDLEISRKRTYKGSFLATDYGDSDGNIGNSNDTDFWTAARQIVDQVYQALTPGAHAVWVVKSFLKNKQIVDFPGQWQTMCEAAGFETAHIHRAWLVKDKGTQIDLGGNHHHKQVERKSFFRRLAEQKGSPHIDYETVFCMRKP